MKKRKILTLLVTLFLLASCNEYFSFPADADDIYYGTLDVDGFSMDAGISLTENGDSTVDVFFDNVKFAVLMPVKIDITVKNVPCRKDVLFSFEATSVDPYINKEKAPQPSYRFSSIKGVVEDDELVLSARMANGLASYVAGKSFSFRGRKTNN